MSGWSECVRALELAGGESVGYYSLEALEQAGVAGVSSLPYSVKILLESVVRMQGHAAYAEGHVTAVAAAGRRGAKRAEIPFMPARVLLQDFTGVPCVVDLAALRSALSRAGRNPRAVEPRIPVDLIIDHSVQLDEAGCAGALERNMAREFERNGERYAFLRWGEGAFQQLRVLPPGLGICHQVNMEYLAACVTTGMDEAGRKIAFPDTCVGTDSHTTTINSMGILGWGVGGIEAEAAMLGQPIPMLTPEVVGVRLTGALPARATATDLALTVTEELRAKGVVGRFVEFFGPGVAGLSLPDRAPVANMAPEYGATMGFFPVDAATLEYLRATGRSEAQVDLVERYCRSQGLFYTADSPEPAYAEVVALDLSSVEPSVAGPRKPHERIAVADLPGAFAKSFPDQARTSATTGPANGSIVIASITSCTNTANPSLLLGAGIVAKKAAARGLTVPGHVRTSFAPGSRAAAEYLRRAGLLEGLERLGFHIAAYGCATCIGNSGPLPEAMAKVVAEDDRVVAAVLSGNRNFEGRIHALTRANYLCSPALVVAYALAGTVRINLARDPVGTDRNGAPVTLAELWPTPEELAAVAGSASDAEIYREVYAGIPDLNPRWNALTGQTSAAFSWDADSTYIQEPPFFMDFPDDAPPLGDIEGAAVLAVLGDFITTDHISPAGAIPEDGPAGRYLIARGVAPGDFNSFGSRRGNHEVMMRGTFGSLRLRNRMVDREGGWTIHHPSGETVTIYDAAARYGAAGAPLVVLAGRLYGAGSSRDWAAKGPALLGVRAVIAESFERIHRSNLIGMGILPLEFLAGDSAGGLGLTGSERISIRGIGDALEPGGLLAVTADAPGAGGKDFAARCRIDTPLELEYCRHGGILNYVLRSMLQ